MRGVTTPSRIHRTARPNSNNSRVTNMNGVRPVHMQFTPIDQESDEKIDHYLSAGGLFFRVVCF